MIEVNIQKKKFNPQKIIKLIEKEKNYGALVSFIGSVRENTKDGKINKLVIEHYEKMANKVIYETALIAKDKWGLDYCYITHRYGTLSIGEPIVMVVTCSKHRKEAYQANQYIIDSLKVNAPFWKKEISDSESRWVKQSI